MITRLSGISDATARQKQADRNNELFDRRESIPDEHLSTREDYRMQGVLEG